MSYETENETAILTFNEELAVGEAELHIDFKGDLNSKMKGFYRSKYFSPDGEERFGAVTQFEVKLISV